MDFVLCRWRTDNESSATCLHKIIREEEMADKILIVEDDEAINNLIANTLRQEIHAMAIITAIARTMKWDG